MSNLEQAILEKQNTIKTAVKLLLTLLVFLLLLILFYNSLDEFEPSEESIDKLKPIASYIIRLDCEEPKKGGRTSSPGLGWIFLEGAPEWLFITLSEVDYSTNCADFYSKVKLGQKATILLKLETKSVAHLEVDGKVLFSHSEYVLNKEKQHESAKWFYLATMFICVLYLVVTLKRTYSPNKVINKDIKS